MRRWAFLALVLVWVPARAPADPLLDEIEWTWPRVRAWEYVAGPTMVTTAMILRFAGPEPGRTWEGGILFDNAITDAVAIRSNFRNTIVLASDIPFFGSMAFRFVDSALLPGLLHGSWDVGLQMTFIDIEAFGIVAIVLWGSQTFIGRERPYVKRCRSDPEFAAREGDCVPDGDWNRSFIAGHPAVGVTAAALTCLHHGHMPLYGGGVGDDLACGLTIGAAAINGVARVLAEKHYTTDLLFGIGLGLFAGYVVPKTLHYGWGDRSEPTEQSSVRAVILPSFAEDRIGLMVFGFL